MADPEPWSADDVVDAHRAAVAIALAAHRNDPEAVGRLWNDTSSQDALVWAMARLPATMIQAVAARDGMTLDPEEVLADLLPDMPATADDLTDPEED